MSIRHNQALAVVVAFLMVSSVAVFAVPATSVPPGPTDSKTQSVGIDTPDGNQTPTEADRSTSLAGSTSNGSSNESADEPVQVVVQFAEPTYANGSRYADSIADYRTRVVERQEPLVSFAQVHPGIRTVDRFLASNTVLLRVNLSRVTLQEITEVEGVEEVQQLATVGPSKLFRGPGQIATADDSGAPNRTIFGFDENGSATTAGENNGSSSSVADADSHQTSASTDGANLSTTPASGMIELIPEQGFMVWTPEAVYHAAGGTTTEVTAPDGSSITDTRGITDYPFPDVQGQAIWTDDAFYVFIPGSGTREITAPDGSSITDTRGVASNAFIPTGAVIWTPDAVYFVGGGSTTEVRAPDGSSITDTRGALFVPRVGGWGIWTDNAVYGFTPNGGTIELTTPSGQSVGGIQGFIDAVPNDGAGALLWNPGAVYAGSSGNAGEVPLPTTGGSITNTTGMIDSFTEACQGLSTERAKYSICPVSTVGDAGEEEINAPDGSSIPGGGMVELEPQARVLLWSPSATYWGNAAGEPDTTSITTPGGNPINGTRGVIDGPRAGGQLIWTGAAVYLYNNETQTTVEITAPDGSSITDTQGVIPLRGEPGAILWTPDAVYLLADGTTTEITAPDGSSITGTRGVIDGFTEGDQAFFTDDAVYARASGTSTVEVTTPGGRSIALFPSADVTATQSFTVASGCCDQIPAGVGVAGNPTIGAPIVATPRASAVISGSDEVSTSSIVHVGTGGPVINDRSLMPTTPWFPYYEMVTYGFVAQTEPPQAAFNVTPSEPTVGESVTFTDRSSDPDGSIVSWEWSFGDGATSTQQNPTHTFDSPGSYTVTLNVTDDDGRTDSATRTVVVSNGTPVAAFNVSPRDPSTGESVSFTDHSSDSDGEIVSWEWSFGDGTTSTQQNPTHTYTSAGSYTVTLTVTDDDGNTDSASETLAVSNGSPVAAFDFSPEAPVAGEPVAFTDQSSDSNGEIVAWNWTFGDGNTSSQQDPTHAFASAGSYSVTLTVTDDDGLTDSTTRTVEVGEPAAGKTVALRPAELSIPAGDTGGVEVVVKNVSAGVGAYNFSLSVNDTEVATIEDVRLRGAPASQDVSMAADNGSVTVTAFGVDTPDSGDVVVATVELHGEAAGMAAVDLTVNVLGDEDGQPLEVGLVRDGSLRVREVTPNEPGPDGEPPGNLASFSETSPLTPDQTTPDSLAGKLRVESDVRPNTTARLVRNTTANTTLAIDVTGEATDVTFYVQQRAIAAAHNLSVVLLRIDGQNRTFYVDESAGPGNSPWVAFQVESFSTRTVSFQNTAAETGPPAVVGGEPPTDPDGDGAYEDVNGDGEMNVIDVQALFANLESDAVQDNVAAFDFNDDGSVDVIDVQALFVEASG